jgi:hypothetical protein
MGKSMDDSVGSGGGKHVRKRRMGVPSTASKPSSSTTTTSSNHHHHPPPGHAYAHHHHHHHGAACDMYHPPSSSASAAGAARATVDNKVHNKFGTDRDPSLMRKVHFIYFYFNVLHFPRIFLIFLRFSHNFPDFF